MTRTTTSRIGAAAALVSLVVAIGASAWSQDAEPASKIVRGPAVALLADGVPAVEVAVAAGVGDLKLVATVGDKGRITVPFAPVERERKLRAALPSDLPPSTKVSYEIVAGNESLAKSELKTLPARGSKRLTFVALGDSGWPSRGGGIAAAEQTGVAELMAKLDPDIAIHTGDVIYLLGQESGIAPLFFAPYAATLARVPFLCCLGNHDVKTKNGEPELTTFPHAANANGNRYYSFDAANVHFACLDSNDPMDADEPEQFGDSAQGKWLKADLAASKADWKVAYFHHPLYSAFPKRAREQDQMRRACEKILEEGGVDLCVTGHDHFYYRSPRVLSGKKDESGIVHVLTGGGGASLYPAEPGELTVAHAKRFHLVHFVVDGFRMSGEALAPTRTGEAEAFDKFEIASKHGRQAD
jgi:hypothetical protein